MFVFAFILYILIILIVFSNSIQIKNCYNYQTLIFHSDDKFYFQNYTQNKISCYTDNPNPTLCEYFNYSTVSCKKKIKSTYECIFSTNSNNIYVRNYDIFCFDCNSNINKCWLEINIDQKIINIKKLVSVNVCLGMFGLVIIGLGLFFMGFKIYGWYYKKPNIVYSPLVTDTLLSNTLINKHLLSNMIFKENAKKSNNSTKKVRFEIKNVEYSPNDQILLPTYGSMNV